ncbi:DUF2752 domain-containing protein [Lactobacillus nasalidis]|uniref:DUF2752 domain-containing protein n=1 Tax=Lactobacillus nasalidis TaxID=2797258 RepID=UPI001A29647B|nr:DUF2752 domain-containing protein [Lactobacillus nasalidis]GHV97061.1 hypothetical protein lacNasYZ01_02430 [Lactobacillus nasalidis]GHV99082.1 hypothetical protein lacNasYZ02_05120 [Lactobacillus nasalidis]
MSKKSINQISIESDAVKKRAKEAIRNVSIILAAALALLASYHLTGHGLPCLFRALTGYLCPGCGMTRAINSILLGNFAQAWQYNPLSLTLLPLLALYLLYKTVRYVFKGEEEFKLGENVFLLLLLLTALCFGIGRNL